MYEIIAYSTRFVNDVHSGAQFYLARVAIKTTMGWKAYEGIFICNDSNQLLNKDHRDLRTVAALGRKLSVEEMLDTEEFEKLPTELYGI